MLALISFLVFSCNSDVNSEQNVEELKEENRYPLDLSLFFGHWNVSLQIQNSLWYHIKGCDENYGLSITESDNESDLAIITMSDRMGMSADLHCSVKNYETDENGIFSMKCIDLYGDNADLIFSGTYLENDGDFSSPCIVLERNAFSNQMIYGIFTDEEVTGIMLFREKEEDKEPQLTDENNCDLGFDDNDAVEFLPEGGLTKDNLTEYMAALLVTNVYLEGGIREGDYVGSAIFGEYFMLIVDRRNGPDSELIFYAIDSLGNLKDEYSITGLFEAFKDEGNYKLDENGKIFCKLGKLEVDEVNVDMKLATENTWISINETGEIQISN